MELWDLTGLPVRVLRFDLCFDLGSAHQRDWRNHETCVGLQAIEAGPAFIEGALDKVGRGIEASAAEIRARVRDAYRKSAK